MRGLKKITFFDVPTSKIISIKIFAFFASRSFHKMIKEEALILGRYRC